MLSAGLRTGLVATGCGRTSRHTRGISQTCRLREMETDPWRELAQPSFPGWPPVWLG